MNSHILQSLPSLRSALKSIHPGTLARQARQLGERLGSGFRGTAECGNTSDPPSSHGWDWRARPVSFDHTPELAARMSRLRVRVVHLLLDCEPAQRDRVLVRLRRARTAVDLWLLRIEVFGCIASKHGENAARARIDSLLPHFEGWVPQRLLRPLPRPHC